VPGSYRAKIGENGQNWPKSPKGTKSPVSGIPGIRAGWFYINPSRRGPVPEFAGVWKRGSGTSRRRSGKRSPGTGSRGTPPAGVREARSRDGTSRSNSRPPRASRVHDMGIRVCTLGVIAIVLFRFWIPRSSHKIPLTSRRASHQPQRGCLRLQGPGPRGTPGTPPRRDRAPPRGVDVKPPREEGSGTPKSAKNPQNGGLPTKRPILAKIAKNGYFLTFFRKSAR